MNPIRPFALAGSGVPLSRQRISPGFPLHRCCPVEFGNEGHSGNDPEDCDRTTIASSVSPVGGGRESCRELAGNR